MIFERALTSTLPVGSADWQLGHLTPLTRLPDHLARPPDHLARPSDHLTPQRTE